MTKTNTMGTVEVLDTSHRDLRHQYGCAATLTTIVFFVCGVAHVARRFWREDMGITGKIELYTHEPYPGFAYTTMSRLGWYTSSVGEDFLRYVAATATDAVGRLAYQLVQDHAAQRAGDLLGEESAARFAAMELR